MWHNVILIAKLKDTDQRLWYAQKAVEHGWSRTMLEHWIKVDLFKREGKAITNFKDRLPIKIPILKKQNAKLEARIRNYFRRCFKVYR